MISPVLIGCLPVLLLFADSNGLDFSTAVKHFFNPFGYTIDMGSSKPGFKYAFILIRTGFRVPDNTNSNTFPSDVNYKKKKWSKGQLTTTGYKMIQMIGRSMEDSRYFGQIYKWSEKRKPVRISVISKRYASDCGDAFDEGLLNNHRDTYRRISLEKGRFDKSDLFVNSGLCKAYDSLWKSVRESREKEILDKNVEFLSDLRKNLGVQEQPDSEWYIHSLEQVYWLWDILEFEKVTRSRKPKWMTKEVKQKLLELVHEYLYESIYGTLDMAKYLVGTLFNTILERERDGVTSLHVHVTDERMFSAVKSVLMNHAPTITEYGETLMFEFTGNGEFQILNFYPISNRYSRLPISGNSINEFVAKFKYYMMDEDTWTRQCNSEPGISTASPYNNRFGTTQNIFTSPTYTLPPGDSKTVIPPPIHFSSSSDGSVAKDSRDALAASPDDDNKGVSSSNGGQKSWYVSNWHIGSTSKNENIEERTTPDSSKPKVRERKYPLKSPIIEEYSPWRPHEYDDHVTAYSSEEDSSLKSRDQGSLTPPSSSLSPSYGAPVSGYGTDSLITPRDNSYFNQQRPTSFSYPFSSFKPQDSQNTPETFHPKPALSSTDLLSQSVSFKDEDDLDTLIPRNGEYARGQVKKKYNGVRTLQNSQFRVVNDDHPLYNSNSGCVTSDGRVVDCTVLHDLDQKQKLLHTAQITTH